MRTDVQESDAGYFTINTTSKTETEQKKEPEVEKSKYITIEDDK